MSIIFALPFLKLFPFFLEYLRHGTFFTRINPFRHGQKKCYRRRGDTEHGEDKQWANGRRQKPKLKERGKGQDRSVMGKRGEIKQETEIQLNS
jgi:hypothetical protein